MKSLRARMLLTFLALATVPLAALTGFAVSKSEELVKHEVWQGNLEVAEASARFIELYVTAAEGRIASEALDPQFQQAAERGDWAAINRSLVILYESGRFFDEVWFLDPQGNRVADFPTSNLWGIRFDDRPYFVNAILADPDDKGTIVTDVYTGTDLARTPHVAVAAQVLRDRNRTGVIVGGINLEKLGHEVRNLTQSPEEVVYLTDRHGNLIYHSSPSVDPERDNFSADPPIRLALSRGQSGVWEGTSVASGGDFLAAYAPVPRFRWALVAAQPTYAAYAGVRELGVVMLGAAGLLVFLLAIGTGALAWQIARPIKELEAGTQSIARGEFSARVEALREDELGNLGRAFNRMASELETQQRELLEYAARLEMMVAERTRALTEKNAEIETFLYTVSHDLKAPLISIQGYVEALKDDSLGEEPRFFLERLDKNAKNMERLIQDLLELSRAGRVTETPRIIDVNGCVHEIVDRLSQRAAEAGAVFVVGPDLPDVWGEPVRVEQIFQNLLDNALKYRDPSRSLVVEVTASKKGDRAEFTVADNGLGIPTEYHSRLFQLFERIPQPDAAESEGTGVGLAIVRRIIGRHGGRIWFESRAGEGTKFHFTIPTRAPSTDRASHERAPSSG